MINEYRLHIDIPLGDDEEKAIQNSKNLVREFGVFLRSSSYDIDKINYRLGYDEDRQKSNYLNKNENGHVTNKKIKMSISG